MWSKYHGSDAAYCGTLDGPGSCVTVDKPLLWYSGDSDWSSSNLEVARAAQGWRYSSTR